MQRPALAVLRCARFAGRRRGPHLGRCTGHGETMRGGSSWAPAWMNRGSLPAGRTTLLRPIASDRRAGPDRSTANRGIQEPDAAESTAMLLRAPRAGAEHRPTAREWRRIPGRSRNRPRSRAISRPVSIDRGVQRGAHRHCDDPPGPGRRFHHFSSESLAGQPHAVREHHFALERGRDLDLGTPHRRSCNGSKPFFGHLQDVLRHAFQLAIRGNTEQALEPRGRDLDRPGGRSLQHEAHVTISGP